MISYTNFCLMPIYTYKNPETGDTKDVLQKMNDEHKYVADGVEWQRIFQAPNAVIDAKLDPFSKKKFVEKTKNIKTYGDAWDISKEMSQEREAKMGKPDEVKKKAEDTFYYKQQQKKKRLL